jgi:aldehyde dehydrogenase (NAD+)
VQLSDVIEESSSSVEVGRRAAKRAESRMLIDGGLLPSASGAEFDNVSPATGLLLGRTVAAEPQDMDRAVDAARRAFDETDWSTNRSLPGVAWRNYSRPSRARKKICAKT